MTTVAVLHGGTSAEREVSLESGRQVAAALREAGFTVRMVDVGADLRTLVADLTPLPDIAFNALHGGFGENGTIQAVLDWLGLPYTHSGVRASAIAMDKQLAKNVFAAAGLPVAKGLVMAAAELADADPMPLPYVIKPVSEGSSVGVEILRQGGNRRAEIASTWQFGSHALVEEYIPGRELSVGVMGDRALTVAELIPAEGFFDYHAKYSDGGAVHVLPAEIHPEVFAQAKAIALQAHQALGCRGASRADFRYDDTAGEPGRLVLLEVNTQPGLTPKSQLPEQAALFGFSFSQLCAWMVQQATCRE